MSENVKTLDIATLQEGDSIEGCHLFREGQCLQATVSERLSTTTVELIVTYMGVFMGRAMYYSDYNLIKWVS